MKGKKLGFKKGSHNVTGGRKPRGGSLKPLVCSLMLIAPVAQAES